MNIIGYHISKNLIATHQGKLRRESPWLRFLMEGEDKIRIVYHLDYSVACLLKMLDFTDDELRTFNDNGEIKKEGYKFKYIPKKFFSIGYGEQFAVFTDASQFMDKSELKNDNETPEALAIRNAYVAYEIGVAVYNSLTKLGLHPKSLTSPVSAFVNEKLLPLNLPTIYDMPEEAAEYAMRCCVGPWVEAFQKGHFKETWDYDLSCYSEDTEVLTPTGWLYIKNIKTGDDILTFNKETNTCCYQKINRMNCHDNYHGDMYHIKTRNADLLITPNHRVLFKEKLRCKDSLQYKRTKKYGYNDKWSIKIASKLPNGNIGIPVSFPIDDREEEKVSDDILRLIAWVNTEGTCKYRNPTGKRKIYSGLSISQSTAVNPTKCRLIENSLNALGIRYIQSGIGSRNEYHIIAKYCQYYLNGLLDQDNIHLIPKWILNKCSIRQLKLYFDVLIMGDGTLGKSNNSMQFFTNLKENADRMMWLSQLLGYRSSINTRYNDNVKQVLRYTVYITTKLDKTNVQFNSTQIEKYKGSVYCPTVDNGFIVVRRNGKACISGNSAYPYQLSQLADIRSGVWIHSNQYELDAYYGYAYGMVTINSDFSPIIFPKSNEQSFTPKGSWERCCTKEQIDYLYWYKRGTFEVYNGWWWYPDKIVQPLKGVMEWLYSKKEQATGIDKMVIKRIMAGTWGRTLQITQKGEPGDFFNPCWGAEVESRTALEVARFVIDNKLEDNLLSIAVDGVLTSKEAENCLV